MIDPAAADPTTGTPPDPRALDPRLAARPRLRGRLHLAATFLALGGLVWLVRSASTVQAALAAWIYGVASVLLYATSSTYHVFTRSPRARRVMRRADHSMIYVLIAGTFTPVCILAMTGPFRWFLLAVVWLGAVAGATVTILALERFHKVTFGLYIGLGWIGVAAIPALLDEPSRLGLMVLAGVLYTVGAILFGMHRPTLSPTWFGYHEVWHTFVVAAGALFFVVNLGLIRGAT